MEVSLVVANIAILVMGVLTAALGGELFVRGSVGLAAWARVPAGLIGATVAAFATSTPELSVGIQAALDGRPELALGDALGSNVVNVAVVLGAVLVLGPMRTGRRDIRRELSFAITAPILTLLALVDGHLGRAEAVVLLGVFVVWIVSVGRAAMHQRSAAADVVGETSRPKVVLNVLAGLGFLVLAGRLIVTAAKGLGTDLGLDPFVVGATLVALGTSAPELATALVARRRGHSEVGVGTVLGSNVFNNLWIVGVVALIRPVQTSVSEVLLAVGACLVALLLVVPLRNGVVPQWRGVALLTIAVAYATGTIALGR
jgi:cation:H+ antiporter